MNMPDYPFKNLIFEGGGVKGIAYVGAMEELDKRAIVQNIKRAGGTSAGAINALLFGLNYSNQDVKQILSALDFKKFLDDSWGYARDSARLIEKFGWYKGEFFRDWAAGLIAQKTGNKESTFKELNDLKDKKGFRDIYIVGTNLSTRFSEVFSCEHTPRMPVADAVRISMSIPLFFSAVRSVRGDVYVDGGVLDNYPVKLFDRKKYIDDADISKNSLIPQYYETTNIQLKAIDRDISPYVYNRETLGFRLDSKEEINMFRNHSEPPVYKIDNFFDYTWGLIETIMEAQANQHLHSDDWQRTIYIDTLGVKTTQFDLDDKTKEALVQSGRENTLTYFQWYDDPKNAVVNRPE
ncbi:MAG: patatin-like phospholipase family protein [Thermodesulfovibrionales bacterium]